MIKIENGQHPELPLKVSKMYLQAQSKLKKTFLMTPTIISIM